MVGKDHQLDAVFVAHAEELSEHARGSFRIARPNWIAGPPRRPDLEVRIRHGERLDRCTIEVRRDGSIDVALDGASDPGIAPGQFAALYDGEECIGGGVIE